MDFGLLPPEINSGRMYSGPGSGPLLAAAAAWDGLADQLYSASAGYGSAISGLVADWQGPSSATMADAVAPYTAWMNNAAAHAEQTATQARATAAAYETAFVATVPPLAIAANRALLTSLIATNILGQNTPAIAATEAHYAQMWAQDSAAMYGYAGSAATAAAQMTPFSAPPRTTNPAGPVGQAGALARVAGTAAAGHAQGGSQVMSATPQALHSLAAPAASTGPQGPLSTISALDGFIAGPLSPISLYKLPAVAQLLAAQCYMLPQAVANLLGAGEKLAAAPAATGTGLLESGIASGGQVLSSAGTGGISAGMGQAHVLSGVAVPQGWASAAPAIGSTAAASSHSSAAAVTAPAAAAATGEQSMLTSLPLSGLAGRAVTGTGGEAASAAAVVPVVEQSAATANVSNIFVIPEADE